MDSRLEFGNIPGECLNFGSNPRIPESWNGWGRNGILSHSNIPGCSNLALNIPGIGNSRDRDPMGLAGADGNFTFRWADPKGNPGKSQRGILDGDGRGRTRKIPAG